MRIAKLTPGLVLLALLACSDTAERAADPTGHETAAARTEQARVIVVFDDAVADAPGLARRLAAEGGGELHFTYQHALKGFAASFPTAAIEGLRRNPNVVLIEPDAKAELHGTQTNPPSWGLDRIDQFDLPLNASYTYPNTGAGVNVYILDTGVRLGHVDFGGRANYIPSAVNGNFVGDTRTNAEDCHGHGTHVAGTAAGTSYGVAKGATIWAGRVVNCQGSGDVSMAIAGVDWITANAVRPAVVNMSLGYGDVQSLRTAVENSITAGVNYAVSAGNGNFVGTPQNACQQSPAGAPNANTVGATASNDSEASFSNYGPCVDILAPGVSITSAWYTSNTATNTISGTSMSSPHVAGAIALYLAANPSATPSQVSSALKGNATLNTINLHRASQSGGTANRFLYVGFIGGGGGNTPPAANFTFSCTGLACSFTDTSTDGDGSIASRSWNFGDGATSTATNPSHTYAAGGTYNVTLTVTDDDGAPDAETKPVTVSSGGGSGISLAASGRQVRGNGFVDLTWSGASGTNVDLYRNGALLTTTPNDGAHTDSLGKSRGSFTYRVCQAGTSTCSNDATAPF